MILLRKLSVYVYNYVEKYCDVLANNVTYGTLHYFKIFFYLRNVTIFLYFYCSHSTCNTCNNTLFKTCFITLLSFFILNCRFSQPHSHSFLSGQSEKSSKIIKKKCKKQKLQISRHLPCHPKFLLFIKGNEKFRFKEVRSSNHQWEKMKSHYEPFFKKKSSSRIPNFSSC